MADKERVHALWIGESRLKHLEILTMNSFVTHGAEFNLWAYHPIRTKLPVGVVLRDGNEILPKDRMFLYPPNMMLGFGGNSYVGFSEIFRYKVLYELGGWWSDMDVTLLKPLETVTDDYWFRFHGVLSVVGNIMKCPPKSELMRLCYERACVEVNDKQTDWHHAIRILCYYVEYLGLSKFVHYDMCNLDRLDLVMPFVSDKGEFDKIPYSWMFLHWMNSVIGKNYKTGSVYHRLLQKYDCTERAMYL